MKRLVPASLLFLLAGQWMESTVLEALAVAVSAYTCLTFVAGLGETIALISCISFIASLEILLVPAITYRVFPASMPIESSAYFAYALPAYIAFYIGINWFGKRERERPHLDYFRDAIPYLQMRPAVCVVLLAIGLVGFLVRTVSPAAPTFVGLLPSHCLLISVFYASYTGSAYRVVVMGSAGLVLLLHTIWSGMFGELFFWLLLLTIFLAASMPERINNRLKTVVFVSAFVFLLLIQSIKGEYRYNTWGYQRTERNGNPALMVALLTDRITHKKT